LHFWPLFGGQWGGQNASKIIKKLLKNDVKKQLVYETTFQWIFVDFGMFFSSKSSIFTLFF